MYVYKIFFISARTRPINSPTLMPEVGQRLLACV